MGTPRDMTPYAKHAAKLAGTVNAAKARARAAEIAPQFKAAREAGCASLRQVAAYLNNLEITTPRGKCWTATAVANAQRLIAA
jgi:hypothetical protein